MDISIFGNLGLVAIFLPLIFGLYLLYSRLNLSFVNKKVLNYGCTITNLFSFLIFSILYFIIPDKNIFNKSFELFSIEKFNFNFGFLIDENNILFLIITSVLCLFLSLYSKKYFDKKKQFIFTKQRFYTFLSLLSFTIYAIFSSLTLFQVVCFLILESILILIFSYIDIFKNATNHNAIRFHRISLIGNLSLACVALILFRYAVYSQGYVETTSLELNNLKSAINYTYGISTIFEFVILCLCFLIAISSKLMLFPLNCYYSFFANSSNIFYLSSASIANGLIGIFLYTKFLPLIEIFKGNLVLLKIFLIFSALVSFSQILFEQNIKIIFGYLFSLINSIFLILFLIFDINIILYCYFAFCFIFTIILAILFLKDKNNISKRLINKRFGFALEKGHILLFENLSLKLTKLTEFIDENFIQKILYLPIKIFNFFISLFIIKTSKTTCFKIIRNILIIFALIALFAIFIALFGGLS